jgi:hypothetical protein
LIRSAAALADLLLISAASECIYFAAAFAWLHMLLRLENDTLHAGTLLRSDLLLR